MATFQDPLFFGMLAAAAKLLMLVGSAAGLAVGIALLVAAGPTLGFLRSMNRWISTRRALKALEVPHGMDRSIVRGRRWLGVVLLAVGAYSLGVLIASLRAPRIAAALDVAFDRHSLTAIALESAWWVLAVGSAAALALGLLLVFVPASLNAVEARANRWVSSRQMMAGGDAMHLPLDRLAEAFPRAAGGAILALSAVAAICSALLVFGRF